MHVQPSWENKLLFPPVVKAQRKEPPMNARLAALVKCVYELRAIGLKACHCIEEFHHWQIRYLFVGRDAPTNARGWSIPTVSLQMVSFPLCPCNTGGNPDLTFSHFVQLCLKKKSMGMWRDCSIRTRQPRGRLTYRCPTATKTLLLR
jgi:hypothetical protein